jgi:hypothetical protein
MVSAWLMPSGASVTSRSDSNVLSKALQNAVAQPDLPASPVLGLPQSSRRFLGAPSLHAEDDELPQARVGGVEPRPRVGFVGPRPTRSLARCDGDGPRAIRKELELVRIHGLFGTSRLSVWASTAPREKKLQTSQPEAVTTSTTFDKMRVWRIRGCTECDGASRLAAIARPDDVCDHSSEVQTTSYQIGRRMLPTGRRRFRPPCTRSVNPPRHPAGR